MVLAFKECFSEYVYTLMQACLVLTLISILRQTVPKFIRKTGLYNSIKRIFIPAYVSKKIFSIGIFIGTSYINLRPSSNIKNPVLTAQDITDVPAVYVADPFMIKRGSTWYMFFEILNYNSRKGEIALAISDDGVSWKYDKIILKEPYHLSYPYIFHCDNVYYMVPESTGVDEVRLYKADDFPTKWSYVKTLIKGRYSDSSIFFYDQRWWLLAAKGFDSLFLFFADNLMGSWSQHPESPLITGDPHIARPGGRVLVLNGKVIRFAQDDFPQYGLKVHALEITELTTEVYKEKLIADSVLKPSGVGWNAKGMHHIDAHQIAENQWIACVDGWCDQIRNLGYN